MVRPHHQRKLKGARVQPVANGVCVCTGHRVGAMVTTLIIARSTLFSAVVTPYHVASLRLLFSFGGVTLWIATDVIHILTYMVTLHSGCDIEPIDS